MAKVDGPAAGALDCWGPTGELMGAESCSGGTGLEGCSGLLGELIGADGCSGEAGAVANVDGPAAGALGCSGLMGE